MSERARRLRPATREDLLALVRRVVYMNPNWGLYLPVWLMTIIHELFGSSITHLASYPDEEAGAIYLKGCERTANGALELHYSETRTAAYMNLHYAAFLFNKRPRRGRRLEIPVDVYQDSDLGQVIRLNMEAARIVKGNAEDSIAEAEPAAPENGQDPHR